MAATRCSPPPPRSVLPPALLGAHVSAAGGSVRALERAVDLGAECMQFFTRAPSRWAARPFEPGEASTFRASRAALGSFPVFAHDIYLTNLASAIGSVREQSLAALVEERLRCADLGVDGLVCHMGAPGPGPDEDEGLWLFSAALSEVLRRTSGCGVPIVLENSAGQGSCLGCRFEQIGFVIDSLDRSPDLAVCIDTCHAFAAGYDLASDAGYARTWADFDRFIGASRLALLHCNDSMRGLGSRVDRHAHIGRGEMGDAPFRRLLHDPRFAGIPVVIETGEAETMHAVNLARLRSMRDARPDPAAACESGSSHPG